MAKGSTFIFAGPEIGERGDALADLRERIAKASGAPPEEHSFYASETTVSSILSILWNASLFAASRLIIIKDADLLKKKEDVEALVSYIEKPAEDTTLVLLSDQVSLDRKLEGSVPKDCKRVFWELFENRKVEWVNAFFRREGFRILPEAVDAILELVENNTDALRRECGRLCLFLDKAKPVDAAMVEDSLSHTREESSFTLFSRIADGDLTRSLEVARALLESKETAVAILAGLAWCFRRLGDYVALKDAGRLNDFELKRVGLGARKAQRDYSAAASRYSARDVERCVSLLASYDIRLRAGGAALEGILMDIFLRQLIAAKARPPMDASDDVL